jgi:hypothetical protein
MFNLLLIRSSDRFLVRLSFWRISSLFIYTIQGSYYLSVGPSLTGELDVYLFSLLLLKFSVYLFILWSTVGKVLKPLVLKHIWLTSMFVWLADVIFGPLGIFSRVALYSFESFTGKIPSFTVSGFTPFYQFWMQSRVDSQFLPWIISRRRLEPSCTFISWHYVSP